jgi:hypothetical protein
MIYAKVHDGVATIKSTLKITHPKANLMTLHIGHDAHAQFPLSAELAFSLGNDFLIDPLPEFASWAVLDHDSRVMSYYYVPLANIAKFISIYADK